MRDSVLSSKGLLLALFILAPISAFTQDLTVDGEVRTRSEIRQGFRSPLPDSVSGAFVSLLRTRLKVNYTKDKVSFRIALQDSRVYGDRPSSNNVNSLGLLEGWGAYAITPEFSATLGRISLGYDDSRLFTHSNWTNGNSHDMLLLKYEPESFRLHVGSAWSNESEVLNGDGDYNVDLYKFLTYLWFNKTFGAVKTSFTYVHDAFQDEATKNVGGMQIDNKYVHRNTLGFYLLMDEKDSPLSASATGYYQFGHDKSNRSLRAGLVGFTADYDITPEFALSVGSDYYTGSKHDLAGGKSRTFNKLYGSNHGFNGDMEYWRSIPERGLVDIFGGFKYKFSPKVSANALLHKLSYAEKSSSSSSDKNLGANLDLILNYNVSPDLAIQAGWSAYFLSDLARSTKGVLENEKFPTWTYLMITFKPNLLTLKK